MAGNIKGITIEFRGDVTPLTKALNTIKAESKKVNNALKQVDNALKFNPHNVELLAQKEQLLKTRVDETKRKLNELRMAQQQLDADPSVDKKSAEYQKLRREIIITESQLRNATKQMILFGNAKLNALGGRIQSVGNKLTSITSKARMAAAAIAGISLYKGFERLKTLDEVETTLQKLGYRGEELEQIMDDATNAVSGTKFALTDMSKVAKGALGSGVTKKYDIGEYLTRVADLAQVSGISVDKMGAMMNKALSKGVVDAKLLNQMNANGIPIYTLLADSMGVTTEQLLKLVRSGEVGFDELYKATEKYNGMAQELGTNTFTGAVTVLGQQFGLMGADFLSGAYEPIKEGVKGIVKYLKELRANGTIKAWGQAVGETIKAFVNWFKTGELAIDGMSKKGKTLTTALAPVVQVIGTVVKAFMALPTQLKVALAMFALFGGPILSLVGGLIKVVGIVGKAISFIKNLQFVFNGVRIAIMALSGPIGIVIGIIAALIAIGIAVYKNWDLIKAKAGELKAYVVKTFTALKASVVSTFNSIKNAMTQPINKAVSTIKAGLNKIKGFFKGLKFQLPHFKLPHFSVKGSFPYGLGGKGTKPSISVKWYKQGGIFDSASLVGIGEAGPEAVVPLSGSQMQPFAQAIADNFKGGFIDYDRLAAAIVSALTGVNTQTVLNIDGKELASATAPYMNTAINQVQARQARKLGYVGV